jgi:hypothetical protein
MSAISALGRMKQEDCEFEASLGYVARTRLKKRDGAWWFMPAIQEVEIKGIKVQGQPRQKASKLELNN